MAVSSAKAALTPYDVIIRNGGMRVEVQPVYENDLWHTDKGGDGKYRFVIGKKDVGLGQELVISTWELYQMKNCCGICVSTMVQVAEEFRGKGIGKILNELRLCIAKLDGYGLIRKLPAHFKR